MGNLFSFDKKINNSPTLSQKEDINKTISVSKNRDNLVDIKIFEQNLAYDPYRLLINNWRIIGDTDDENHYVDIRLRGFPLPTRIIVEIEKKWENSIFEVQDYLQFCKTVFRPLLKKHHTYISNLKKIYLDPIVRYIRGTSMNLKYGVNSVCFGGQSYNSSITSLQSSDSFNLTNEEKLFNIKHHVRDVGLYNMKDIHSIMDVIKKSPKPKTPIKLFRGIKISDIYNASVGQKLYHPSIMSTSLMVTTGVEFSSGQNPCLLELSIEPKECNCLAVYDYFSDVVPMRNEFEVLLPPCVMIVSNVYETKISDYLTPIEKRIANLSNMVFPSQIRIIQVDVKKPANISFNWDAQCITMS